MLTQKEIAEKLLETPEIILSIQKGRAKLEMDLIDVTRAILDIKNKISLEVLFEKDTDGKDKYSNQQKRDIEIEKRLSAIADYNEKSKIARDIEASITTNKINLEYQNNLFKTYQIIAEISKPTIVQVGQQ